MAGCCHAELADVWPSPRHGQPELLARPVPLLGGAGVTSNQQRAGKPLSRDASPPVADHRPAGSNVTDAATPRRLGTLAPPPDRGWFMACLTSHPSRGLGTGAAALCGASPAVPLAEPVSSTNPSAIRSTASEVVNPTAYRHRVTFALLRFDPRYFCAKFQIPPDFVVKSQAIDIAEVILAPIR